MSVEIALYENVLSEGIKNEIDVVDVDVDDFELAIVCINGEALVLFNGRKISLCWILCIVWSDEKRRAGVVGIIQKLDTLINKIRVTVNKIGLIRDNLLPLSSTPFFNGVTFNHDPGRPPFYGATFNHDPGRPSFYVVFSIQYVRYIRQLRPTRMPTTHFCVFNCNKK